MIDIEYDIHIHIDINIHFQYQVYIKAIVIYNSQFDIYTY